MDLEFDKEMDALLRKAAGRGVLVGDKPNGHLDADTIAAFVENALPQKSRMIYTQHLAACDPCRMSLANLISMNAAAEPAMAAAAAPVPAVSVPWYRKLFQAPNLAYVMGGLVLVFGGLFGVYVLQNSFSDRRSAISMVEQPATVQNAPARAEGANSVVAANTNSSPNVAIGEMPQGVGVADSSVIEESSVTAPPAEPNAAPANADTTATKPISTDGFDKDKAAGFAQAPAPAKEAPKREEVEKAKNEVKLAAEQELRKDDAKAANLYNTQQQQQNQVQMMPDAGNKTSGPNRNMQRDNRAYDRQMEDNAGARAKKAEAAPATSAEGSGSSVRAAGGKKFQLKQGAWYDTSYTGQATTNVQRGTEAFQKLDSGLRNIANSIGGTVVVVWKGKAYRFQ